MGLVQRESGDYTAAVTTLERALAIDRQLGSRWALAYDLRNLGQTRLKMGDPTAAVAQFSEAASLATAIGDKVNGAKILLARGDAEMALQQMTAAETSYRGALESADQLLLRELPFAVPTVHVDALWHHRLHRAGAHQWLRATILTLAQTAQ